ncbi:hypothetical protein J7T55_004782 [Diaporthe amygdali]|uniref:uncharacterized protein n=1 Tax=Phomopsis amygdali TaxID=1214568 RepID=UPI0022FE8349|nr:uncharacterized protein J7T55_004782 [Diaporthe amygdali]KAJ0114538.1 hypothetical protein J7T55_004782 [Diaporthe amygdali]
MDDASKSSAQPEGVASASPFTQAQVPEPTHKSESSSQERHDSKDGGSFDTVMELVPIADVSPGAIDVSTIDVPNKEGDVVVGALEPALDKERLVDENYNKPSLQPASFGVDNSSDASTLIKVPQAKLEDAHQEHPHDTIDDAEAAVGKSSANTANPLPMNQDDMFCDRSDDDIDKEMKSLVHEEELLQHRQSESYWTDQDAMRLQWVHERMELLDNVWASRTVPQARAAAKCLGHNELPQSHMPVRGTKKSTASNKRKSEASTDDNPVVKKPRTSTKPTKGQKQAVDFVTKSMFNQMSGETDESLNADAMKNLESISKAPTLIREHLKAIQAAGLELPNAKPEIIKAHAKALGGISRAFSTIVSPWVTEGDGKKTIDDFKWQITGMRYPLHHHQLVAAGNMSTIEKDNENDGSTKFALLSGLLYDHMGYGKTIETLACILSNSPRGKRSFNGSWTTLVVVPKSAAEQWADEVKIHCTNVTATVYDKGSEASKEKWRKELASDILIITYDQLRVSHQRFEGKKKPKSWLFESKFYRVVLDEAHKIKNPKSEIFGICLKLKSKHKWCLTGTPIQNGVSEIFAPLKFLGHPMAEDFSDFKSKYLGGRGGKDLPTEGPRYSDLSRLLEPIMIMRTPGHSFLGCALVSLPETHALLSHVTLSREEEIIQEYIDKHMRAYLTKKAAGQTKEKKPGRPRKNTSQAAGVPSEKLSWQSLNEVLMRKRQSVASPALLENLVKGGIWTLDQVRSMRDEVHKTGIVDTPFIDLFEKWIKEPKSRDYSSGNRKVDELQAQAGASRPCSLLPTISDRSRKSKIRRSRLRGDDYNGFQPRDESGSTLFRILDTASPAVPLSSKMKAVLKQIQDWEVEAKEDKIIVFSQFIGFSRLLGRVLQDNGIDFLFFVGEMDDDQRQQAKLTFKEHSEVKVLMISMKCGGEALNLTTANRVIITDPWWNRSVEAQAIARVYRIGQIKTTYATRVLAGNTIDDEIYHLQEKKLSQMRNCLEEFQADKGLGARALRRLLGSRWKEKGDDDHGSDDESDFDYEVKEDNSEDGDYLD